MSIWPAICSCRIPFFNAVIPEALQILETGDTKHILALQCCHQQVDNHNAEDHNLNIAEFNKIWHYGLVPGLVSLHHAPYSSFSEANCMQYKIIDQLWRWQEGCQATAFQAKILGQHGDGESLGGCAVLPDLLGNVF